MVEALDDLTAPVAEEEGGLREAAALQKALVERVVPGSAPCHRAWEGSAAVRTNARLAAEEAASAWRGERELARASTHAMLLLVSAQPTTRVRAADDTHLLPVGLADADLHTRRQEVGAVAIPVLGGDFAADHAPKPIPVLLSGRG